MQAFLALKQGHAIILVLRRADATVLYFKRSNTAALALKKAVTYDVSVALLFYASGYEVIRSLFYCLQGGNKTCDKQLE